MINRTFQMLSEISALEGKQGCDLHHYLFNQDYAFIYTEDAEKACEELGVFDCINLVRNYEEHHFGKLITDLEPFNIANMCAYIMGDELLMKSHHLRDKCWDRCLTSQDIEKIINEINSELPNDIFEEVIGIYC